MAFSTQKDFLNYQLMNDKFDARYAKVGAMKLKSYGSSIDKTSFDVNKKETQKFISDQCKKNESTTGKISDIINKGENESNNVSMQFHTESEVRGLTGSINLENTSNEQITTQLQYCTQELSEVKHKLQDTELGYKNITNENKTLRILLGSMPINDKCKPLLDAIRKLRADNKITISDEKCLYYLIKGLSSSLENISKQDNQIQYLEAKKSNIITSETNIELKLKEPYEKIFHERNKLRVQLCRMAEFEDKIKMLKEKAHRSDWLEMQLILANQKLLAIQLTANKQLEASCENEQLKKQLRNAENIMRENYNLKRELTKKMFELTGTKTVEKELEIAKDEICRYETMIRDYDCQLMQAMEVAEELVNERNDLKTAVSENKICKSPYNKYSKTISDCQIQELADTSRATLEQLHLELKAKNILKMELKSTKEELENLRMKSGQDADKLESMLLENHSLKEYLDKIFQEIFYIIECSVDYSEYDKNNEDIQSKCERKIQILRDDINNFKNRHDSEIEVYKKQILELTFVEEAVTNEKTRENEKNNEVVIKQEIITKLQQKALEDTEKALEEQKKLVASFQQDLENQKLAVRNSRLHLQSLDTENKNLKTENSNLFRELGEKENSIEKIKKENIDLRKELMLVEGDLEKVNEKNSMQITGFLEKICQLEKELTEIKTELAQKEEKVKNMEEKNEKEGDKRMVEVYALREMESKKNKELTELLQDVEDKLLKCTKKENKKFNASSPSLQNITEKLKQELENEDEKKKLIEKSILKETVNSDTLNDKRPRGGNDNKEHLVPVNKIENLHYEKLKFAPLAGLTLYSCYTPATMTKLQIVCKKIFDYGIDCLTVKELIYLHCFIYKASIKQKPEIMKCVPGEQKCCKCTNFSCCLPNILRETEKRLDARLETIERDVEILDRSLNFLKQKDDVQFLDKGCGDNDSKIFNKSLFSEKRKCMSSRDKTQKNRSFEPPTRDNVI